MLEFELIEIKFKVKFEGNSEPLSQNSELI